MGQVRKLEREDIPRVVELNNRLFPTSARLGLAHQEKVFEEVCFNNPWRDRDVTSLVYEEDGGALSGFLGVVARPMELEGRPVRAAVFQHLMVDRSTLASFQLFRTLLAGPQDLSLGENAVEVVHRVWDRLGHPVSRLNSIYWRRFLRPLSLGAAQLAKRSMLLGRAAMPVCRAVDAALARLPINPLRVPSLPADDDELDETLMLCEMPGMMEHCALRPVYTPETLQWLLRTLEGEHRNGSFQKKIVKTPEGRTAGWYLYYLNPGGTSVVFQIAGKEKTIGLVLDHLFAHALGHGALELVGRIEPRFMKTLREKHCYFMPGRNWMLLHSRHAEILHAIDRGDAFLSRLEGDLWVL